MSALRHFLLKVIPKENLQQMLKVLSPNKIGYILGVKGETISSFAKNVYGIEIQQNSRSYYMSIQHSIRNLSKASQYYGEFHYWSNYLGNLEKYKNQ